MCKGTSMRLNHILMLLFLPGACNGKCPPTSFDLSCWVRRNESDLHRLRDIVLHHALPSAELGTLCARCGILDVVRGRGLTDGGVEFFVYAEGTVAGGVSIRVAWIPTDRSEEMTRDAQASQGRRENVHLEGPWWMLTQY